MVNVVGSDVVGVDVGVDNLLACSVFSNGGSSQFLIDGRNIKSVNHYYNKMMAGLKSKRPDNKGTTRNVVTSGGLYNLLAREYQYDSGDAVRANNLYTSSFAVVHQIDGVLNYK